MTVSVVTGAAGFIGSHLVDRLLGLGHRVVGLDDLSLGQMKNLSQAVKCDRFRFLKTDVGNQSELIAGLDELRGAAVEVWHLAANSDIQAGVADPSVDLERTFLTSFAVLRILDRFEVKRLFFSSTSAVYGPQPGKIKESIGPLLPISAYGAMKLASEAVFSAHVEKYPTQLSIFRFPNVVGSRSTHGILFDFFNRAASNPKTLEVLGNGTQQKQYLHVSELIDAMICVRSACQEKRGLYNIGPLDTSTTVRAIAAAFKEIAHPEIELKFGQSDRGWVGDVPRFELDVSKICDLGWRPHFNSNEAIFRAIEELKQERNL
jgi:UDP-glucose 4-epimerase